MKLHDRHYLMNFDPVDRWTFLAKRRPIRISPPVLSVYQGMSHSELEMEEPRLFALPGHRRKPGDLDAFTVSA